MEVNRFSREHNSGLLCGVQIIQGEYVCIGY